MSDILVTEDAFEAIAEDRIDRERGIIRGVKLLGLRSLNKRNYDTPGVQKSAMKLLPGTSIYIDHPATATTSRSYRDKFAVVGQKVEYRPGEGYFGDVHFNPKHAVAEQFLWDVVNAPKSLGMSINSSIKSGKVGADGDMIVESIEVLRSVDIVTKPATTAGIFESEEEEIMDLKTLRDKHPELVKSILEESQATDATESALALAKKEKDNLQARLDALEAERATEKLQSEVSAEFTKVFEGVTIEEALMKEIVECACEMQEGARKKFSSVLSKISPMLIDDNPDDTEETPVKEEEEQAKKPAYRPTQGTKAGYKKGTLLADLGIGK